MSDLEKLISYFQDFPGIGARQAKRFAFHILTMNQNDTTELAKLISELKQNVVECVSCHRFFSTTNQESVCNICGSSNRNHNRLLIVERDSDIISIERAGVYDGLYFVFGGTVPLLDSKENKKLRAGTLKATVEARAQDGLSEIILGFSVNPDGENTSRFIESVVKPLFEDKKVNITYLGRGLSTGSELEYADPETIKNALVNRFSH